MNNWHNLHSLLITVLNVALCIIERSRFDAHVSFIAACCFALSSRVRLRPFRGKLCTYWVELECDVAALLVASVQGLRPFPVPLSGLTSSQCGLWSYTL